ncbi:hypothetical protein ACLOJK_033623 [Asimina triloba]
MRTRFCLRSHGINENARVAVQDIPQNPRGNLCLVRPTQHEQMWGLPYNYDRRRASQSKAEISEGLESRQTTAPFHPPQLISSSFLAFSSSLASNWPLIWWAIMALATASSLAAADDDGSGGGGGGGSGSGDVPPAGLLCISECATCPVICSPPPKPVYYFPPSPPWPKTPPMYYYYPPSNNHKKSPPPPPPPPPPPSPISYSWGVPPPPNIYVNIPSLPSPPGMVGGPPGGYPYPYYYFYASPSPPSLLGFSTTFYLLLLFFHLAFLRWL